MDPYEQHLLALHEELAGQGMRSVLYTHGIRPRPRIYGDEVLPSCAFDNHVIAAALTAQWIFWWTWAEPIGPVSQLAHTAATILDDLGLRDDGPASGGPHSLPPAVPSLDVRRRRSAGMPRPRSPRPDAAASLPGRGQPGGGR
jgi:hypothetical protein